jgi:hypothetical protein
VLPLRTSVPVATQPDDASSDIAASSAGTRATERLCRGAVDDHTRRRPFGPGRV